jgi:hypothetical protein
LFFFGFLFLLGLFVFVTPVIHNLADRRGCRGRNFYQIKAEFSRCLQGILNRYNPQLIAFRIDYPDFACANGTVDINAIRSARL